MKIAEVGNIIEFRGLQGIVEKVNENSVIVALEHSLQSIQACRFDLYE